MREPCTDKGKKQSTFAWALGLFDVVGVINPIKDDQGSNFGPLCLEKGKSLLKSDDKFVLTLSEIYILKEVPFQLDKK